MPTYEYRCPEGHDFEQFVLNMSKAVAELPCPVCGKLAARRISAGAGLVFKGSGFYITDYGKDGKKDQKGSGEADKSGGEAKGGGAAEKSSGEAGTSGGDAKGDTRSGEAKGGGAAEKSGARGEPSVKPAAPAPSAPPKKSGGAE